MPNWLKHLVAFLHLSDRVVCELSVGLGVADDYHDYPDSIEGQPWHFTTLTCKRCSKKFII